MLWLMPAQVKPAQQFDSAAAQDSPSGTQASGRDVRVPATVRRVTPDGGASAVAGGCPQPALDAAVDGPADAAGDSRGCAQPANSAPRTDRPQRAPMALGWSIRMGCWKRQAWADTTTSTILSSRRWRCSVRRDACRARESADRCLGTGPADAGLPSRRCRDAGKQFGPEVHVLAPAGDVERPCSCRGAPVRATAKRAAVVLQRFRIGWHANARTRACSPAALTARDCRSANEGIDLTGVSLWARRKDSSPCGALAPRSSRVSAFDDDAQATGQEARGQQLIDGTVNRSESPLLPGAGRARCRHCLLGSVTERVAPLECRC